MFLVSVHNYYIIQVRSKEFGMEKFKDFKTIAIKDGFTYEKLSDETKKQLDIYVKNNEQFENRLKFVGSKEFFQLMVSQYTPDESDEILRQVSDADMKELANLFKIEHALNLLIRVGTIIDKYETPQGYMTLEDVSPDTQTDYMKQLANLAQDGDTGNFLVFNACYCLANTASRRKAVSEIENNKIVRSYKDGVNLLRSSALALLFEDGFSINPIDFYFEKCSEHWKDGCEIRLNVKEQMFAIVRKKPKNSDVVIKKQTPDEIERNRIKKGLNVVYLPNETQAPTINGYANALNKYVPMQSKKQANFAGMVPASLFDNVEYVDGKFLDVTGEDITERWSGELLDGTLTAQIKGEISDPQLMSALFTAYCIAVQQNPEITLKSNYVDIDINSLIGFLYGSNKHTTELIKKIEDRGRALKGSASGLIVKRIPELKVDKKTGTGKWVYRQSVIKADLGGWAHTEQGETNTFRFTVPYIADVYSGMVEARQEEMERRIQYNEEHKRNKKSLDVYTTHDYNLSILERQADKSAIAIVKLITQRIAMSGAYYEKVTDIKTGAKAHYHRIDRKPGKKAQIIVPFVYWKEILELMDLDDVINPTSKFSRCIDNVYIYLDDFTRMKELFPEIIYPGHNMEFHPKNMKAHEKEFWRPTYAKLVKELKNKPDKAIRFYLTTLDESAKE